MTHPARCHLRLPTRWVVSFNRSNSFQVASVLSVSRQQPTIVKYWKMASFFKKLILIITAIMSSHRRRGFIFWGGEGGGGCRSCQRWHDAFWCARYLMNLVGELEPKIISMIRKYHNHKPQTHGTCEEEPYNHHETTGTQSSLFPIKMIAKLEHTTKHRTSTDSHNGSNNKQQVNNNRTTALERIAASATGGLKYILLVPNICPRLCCCWSTRNVQLAWKPSN